MQITDFAEMTKRYTGANNKRKWVITNKNVLETYFQICEFKPSELAKRLKTSYSTVKRFLVSAELWNKAVIRNTPWKSGRKRTANKDKFGYKLANSEYDFKNDRGDIVRRYEHHVNAEKKYRRKLKDSEVVHHIDGDKQNNSHNNLLICEDNKNHRRLHGSLERAAFEAVKKGIIKFHEDHGYYLNEKVAAYETDFS